MSKPEKYLCAYSVCLSQIIAQDTSSLSESQGQRKHRTSSALVVPQVFRVGCLHPAVSIRPRGGARDPGAHREGGVWRGSCSPSPGGHRRFLFRPRPAPGGGGELALLALRQERLAPRGLCQQSRDAAPWGLPGRSSTPGPPQGVTATHQRQKRYTAVQAAPSALDPFSSSQEL